MFTAPLILIAFIIILVVIACCYFVAKRKYKQKENALASQAKRLSGVLDELFRPDTKYLCFNSTNKEGGCDFFDTKRSAKG